MTDSPKTIKIAMKTGGVRRVDAEAVSGLWAVAADPENEDRPFFYPPAFKVTHRPTGMSVYCGPLDKAIALMLALDADPLAKKFGEGRRMARSARDAANARRIKNADVVKRIVDAHRAANTNGEDPKP